MVVQKRIKKPKAIFKRDHSEVKKVAVLIECAKYFDRVKNRLVSGALAAICDQFHPIGRSTIERWASAYKTAQQNGTMYPDIKSKSWTSTSWTG
jgi:hypothetical protein